MTHSLECEVALKDRLPDLCEDGALGIGQIHLPDACVSQAALVLLLGFLSLPKATDTHNCVRYGWESCVATPSTAAPTFWRASSSSFLFFSSCLLTALDCSSRERLVDDCAFSYSSLLSDFSARAFRKAASASCCQNPKSKQNRPRC